MSHNSNIPHISKDKSIKDFELNVNETKNNEGSILVNVSGPDISFVYIQYRDKCNEFVAKNGARIGFVRNVRFMDVYQNFVVMSINMEWLLVINHVDGRVIVPRTHEIKAFYVNDKLYYSYYFSHNEDEIREYYESINYYIQSGLVNIDITPAVFFNRKFIIDNLGTNVVSNIQSFYVEDNLIICAQMLDDYKYKEIIYDTISGSFKENFIKCDTKNFVSENWK